MGAAWGVSMAHQDIFLTKDVGGSLRVFWLNVNDFIMGY